jgi:hypothetical protein
MVTIGCAVYACFVAVPQSDERDDAPALSGWEPPQPPLADGC